MMRKKSVKTALAVSAIAVLGVTGSVCAQDEEAAPEARQEDKSAADVLKPVDTKVFSSLFKCRLVDGTVEIRKQGEDTWVKAKEGHYYPLGSSIRTMSELGAPVRVEISFGTDCILWTTNVAEIATRPIEIGENTRTVELKSGRINLNLPRDTKWASGNAWAPAIEEKMVDGKYRYFFYYSGETGHGKAIGVAVADTPTGPFKDLGHPIVDKRPEGQRHGQQIDVDVFTDPDTGKSYLYWGNGYMAGAELNDDMTSINEATVTLMTPRGGTLEDYAYREAPYVFKRNGTYYFLWSVDDTGAANYHVAYGTSTCRSFSFRIQRMRSMGRHTTAFSRFRDETNGTSSTIASTRIISISRRHRASTAKCALTKWSSMPTEPSVAHAPPRTVSEPSADSFRRLYWLSMFRQLPVPAFLFR